MEILKKFIIFIFTLNLDANNITLELKAYIIKDLTKLYVKNNPKKIYINSYYFNQVKKILNYPYIVVNNPKKSDICFVERFNKNCKIVFVTSYLSYLKDHSKVAGAFFWQKGRPTIILNTDFIKKHNIKIPKEYKEFEE